jgi:hypothetical protein
MTPRAPNATINNQFVGNIEMCANMVTKMHLEDENEMEEKVEVWSKTVPIKKELVDDDYFIILPEKRNEVREEVPVATRYFEN